MQLKIEYLTIDSLTPYERNTRKHGEYDVEQIATSIQKYGFDDPVGVWGEKNIIVEGHGRVMAARKLGMSEVPCVRLDHLTEKERREYAIMHNKTAELSAWDFDLLPFEMEDLNFEGFDVFNEMQFDASMIDEYLEAQGQKEKKQKTMKCPHCGELIVL